ncbi:hypothetical protein PFY12_10645 [Chryseobacterium camelliae]|uniref:Uncharacterized protein n=1 Tax=Chryseobacterium camelliae TaxID=1265445 RepID=A0ABY7QJF9_9FLAO|nr:hypothetical protein [Chryseobacterium camelliae]WBV59514.1 hypothetical protein PFY12_10645 [Chryseobacterium camelliae]
MKKQIFSLAIFTSALVSAQIYAPAGSTIGTTVNPTSANIGIGTNNPLSTLEVAGHAIFSDIVSSGSNSWRFHTPDDGRKTLHIAFRSAYDTDYSNWEWDKAFIINGENGNAMVQGKLEAKEIKVTLTPTADFVFEEDYALPKLEEVEKHIKEKKHLPEIASAKEMEKEGVNVGEFQIKLLQKIEELTLYTIEQNKLIKEQQKRIEKLENNSKLKK